MKTAFKYLLSLLIIISIQLYAQAPTKLKPIIEVTDTIPGTALGRYCKGVGDINKDGFDDVVVSATETRISYLYYGGKPMSKIPAKAFRGGGRIATGDFNGDGWRDLAIELNFRDTVLVYYGGQQIDTIPDLILHAEQFSPGKVEGFGIGLQVGDMNGDGYDDLVVSAGQNTQNNDSTYKRGKIYVYKGSQSGIVPNPIWTIVGNTTVMFLGYDLAIGDINNDGKKDIIALGLNGLANNANNQFFYIKVFINKGNFVFEQKYYIDSRNTAGKFTDHIECFDADGDGINDILANRIYIFKGGTNFDTIPTYYVPPPYNDTVSYGAHPWVTGGGDYNNDGITDLLLSTSLYTGAPGFRVYLGGRGKEPQFVAYRSFSECCGDVLYFPEDAGDVNGDGVDDIISGGNHSVNGVFGIYSGDTNLVTSVKPEKDILLKDFELQQNYPNPFNPETVIEYSLSKTENVLITIYDNNGKKLKTLVNTTQSAGGYTMHWNGTDDAGIKLSSGVYFYRIKTTNNSEVKKAILLK